MLQELPSRLDLPDRRGGARRTDEAGLDAVPVCATLPPRGSRTLLLTYPAISGDRDMDLRVPTVLEPLIVGLCLPDGVGETKVGLR